MTTSIRLPISLVATNRALQPAVAQLHSDFDVRYLDELNSSQYPEVSGLLTSGWDRVNADLLMRFPGLKVISHMANGLDALDMDHIRQRGIAVFNTPEVVVNDTADLALGLILAVSRRVVSNHRFVLRGNWGSQSYAMGRSLSGKTVGIVGLGRIGKAIAQRCQAFQMNVIYWGRQDKGLKDYSFRDNLLDLAREADFVVVSCAGNEQTRGLINNNVLSEMGKEAILVNVARGFIVEESALIVALQTGQIGGAGLDVFEYEPVVPSPFLEMDNVVLQPHAGSATVETRREMFRQVASNLMSYYIQTSKNS